jgi:hypothetical protein
MLGLAIGLIVSALWLAFEVWKAPVYDEDMRLIQREKNLSDLFKKNNKNK